MLRQGCAYTQERERVLADGLKEVAAELRLIDPADFVAFIRTERHGNISTLVNSATEMYFKPGIITFGRAGRVDLRWDGNPSISLDMEFHHQRIDVFFQLVLESAQAGVDIHYISFGGAVLGARKSANRLAAAIADARIPLLMPFDRRHLAESPVERIPGRGLDSPQPF
jgi:hypothetical protein